MAGAILRFAERDVPHSPTPLLKGRELLVEHLTSSGVAVAVRLERMQDEVR